MATAEIQARYRALPFPDTASRPAMEATVANQPSSEAPELRDTAVNAMTEAAVAQAATEAA